MTGEPINPDISKRICNHMNKDHTEAVLAYAKHYGGEKSAQKARMLEITSNLMKLEVDEKLIEIFFQKSLRNSEDAHQTLVSMLKSIPKDN